MYVIDSVVSVILLKFYVCMYVCMTCDLPSALEVCFKRDALNKSMFTLLYFTLLYFVYRLIANNAGCCYGCRCM